MDRNAMIEEIRSRVASSRRTEQITLEPFGELNLRELSSKDFTEAMAKSDSYEHEPNGQFSNNGDVSLWYAYVCSKVLVDGNGDQELDSDEGRQLLIEDVNFAALKQLYLECARVGGLNREDSEKKESNNAKP